MKILIEESVLRQALDALCYMYNEDEIHQNTLEIITALRSALDAAEQDNQRISELEAVIKSHGIPVKTYSGGVPHYCMGEK